MRRRFKKYLTMDFKLRLFFLLILSFCIFSSCSIKKRAYRPGYYIDWTLQPKNKKTTEPKTAQDLSNKKHREEIPKDADVVSDEVAAADNRVHEKTFLYPVKPLITQDTGCGDILTFKKGNELKVKVLEINETQVKYKHCDNLDGPLFIVHKNEVYSIKYKNGFTEYFERVVEPQKNIPQTKEIHPDAELALVWLISTVFTSAVGLILAAIFAARAKRKILAEPNKYTGLKIVKVCQIICLVFLIITIIGFFFALYGLGILLI